ncbi:MAG: hypothetical protein JHC33_07670, partial [Ignisphaera sp.]|nr:hypothetical protein [Ignisphaera sp.]
KIYATSGQLQQLLPIDPQQTAYISSKALTELTAVCPQYFTVLDTDGSADDSVTHRDKVQMTGSWVYYDLGKYAGSITITNPTGNALVQFSLSGGTGVGVAPLASTISDVLIGETLTINQVIEPVRYIYLLGTNTQYVYILVN